MTTDSNWKSKLKQVETTIKQEWEQAKPEVAGAVTEIGKGVEAGAHKTAILLDKLADKASAGGPDRLLETAATKTQSVPVAGGLAAKLRDKVAASGGTGGVISRASDSVEQAGGVAREKSEVASRKVHASPDPANPAEPAAEATPGTGTPPSDIL